MSETVASDAVTWIVIEQGDRWYRAICRFAPAVREPITALRVQRVPFDRPTSVLSRVKSVPGAVFVVWEVALNGTDVETCLEVIATIRSELPLAKQSAWLPATASPDLRLAAQEAGITFFLDGLESLEAIVRAAPVSKNRSSA